VIEILVIKFYKFLQKRNINFNIFKIRHQIINYFNYLEDIGCLVEQDFENIFCSLKTMDFKDVFKKENYISSFFKFLNYDIVNLYDINTFLNKSNLELFITLKNHYRNLFFALFKDNKLCQMENQIANYPKLDIERLLETYSNLSKDGKEIHNYFQNLNELNIFLNNKTVQKNKNLYKKTSTIFDNYLYLYLKNIYQSEVSQKGKF
jgi:hypothetical protein